MRSCSTLTPCPLPATDVSYLVLRGLHSWPVLSEDHGQGKEKHEQSVTHIAKHHSEEKGEGDNGVGSCRQKGHHQVRFREGLGICFLVWVATEGPPGPAKSMSVKQGPRAHIPEPTTVNLGHLELAT